MCIWCSASTQGQIINILYIYMYFNSRVNILLWTLSSSLSIYLWRLNLWILISRIISQQISYFSSRNLFRMVKRKASKGKWFEFLSKIWTVDSCIVSCFSRYSQNWSWSWQWHKYQYGKVVMSQKHLGRASICNYLACHKLYMCSVKPAKTLDC